MTHQSIEDLETLTEAGDRTGRLLWAIRSTRCDYTTLAFSLQTRLQRALGGSTYWLMSTQAAFVIAMYGWLYQGQAQTHGHCLVFSLQQ